MLWQQYKNKTVARLAGLFPSLADKLVASYIPWGGDDIPWQPVKKALAISKIALVTTAGVHHQGQTPFDMTDAQGDPTFRVLTRDSIIDDHTITHDYYDHRDADKDLNIVFPLERLLEMNRAGVIGAIAERHYSFMGHIDGHHIYDLMQNQAPGVAEMLLVDDVDAVLLTPG
jgi:D-proline reductase (dithiol) PrdB